MKKYLIDSDILIVLEFTKTSNLIYAKEKARLKKMVI
jgi:hypothetical protein